jgi:hypothetical protein
MKFHMAVCFGKERDERSDKFIISESDDGLFSLLSGFQTEPSINLYIYVLANANYYN